MIVSEVGPTPIPLEGRKSTFILKCCERAATDFGIADLDVVGRRTFPNEDHVIGKEKKPKKQKRTIEERTAALTQEMIDRVDAELPPQPWKPRVHKQIAAKLGWESADVSAAINRLVELGRRNTQRDGVVYGQDGTILAVDPERVTDLQPDA